MPSPSSRRQAGSRRSGSSLHLLRAFALDAMGSPDRAAAAFRQAWTLDPDNPVTAYLALTRSAIDGADLGRARDTLLRTVQDVIRGASHTAAFAVPAGPVSSTRPAAPLVFHWPATPMASRSALRGPD